MMGTYYIASSLCNIDLRNYNYHLAKKSKSAILTSGQAWLLRQLRVCLVACTGFCRVALCILDKGNQAEWMQ
uniref:Uncharacterized protein n=1 Tax=Arundo donax TaxID=35708 RepID=A0A0A9DHT2_ARUDO